MTYLGNSLSFTLAATILFALLFSPAQAEASGRLALLDVEARRAELELPAFASAQKACLARSVADAGALPKPVKALKPTAEYGNDTSSEPYAWHVMVLAGRSLAGDRDAEQRLHKALLSWAEADALVASKKLYDPYYAIKRTMLPVIQAYAIVQDRFSGQEQEQVEHWIDTLVRNADKKYDGDVDINNHRYLADALLMTWGAFIDDEALYDKGMERYRIILTDARPDGGLPLETRRGARAAWYMRQSLASMTVMAEVARLHGDDLYDLTVDGKSIDTVMQSYLDMVRNPLIVLPYAAENYIPGPEQDFFAPDMGMLHPRPNARHYMAFAEAYLHSHRDSFSGARLANLIARTGAEQRPLIDDFSGGNATCFWWKPEGV